MREIQQGTWEAEIRTAGYPAERLIEEYRRSGAGEFMSPPIEVLLKRIVTGRSALIKQRVLIQQKQKTLRDQVNASEQKYFRLAFPNKGTKQDKALYLQWRKASGASPKRKGSRTRSTTQSAPQWIKWKIWPRVLHWSTNGIPLVWRTWFTEVTTRVYMLNFYAKNNRYLADGFQQLEKHLLGMKTAHDRAHPPKGKSGKR